MNGSKKYKAVFREVIGGIILEQFDDEYAKTEGLSPSDAGKFIKGLLSPDEEKRVDHFLSGFRGSVFSQHYLRSAGDAGIWRVDVLVRYPVAEFSGSRIDLSGDDPGKPGMDDLSCDNMIFVANVDKENVSLVYKSHDIDDGIPGMDAAGLMQMLRPHLIQCSCSGQCTRLCLPVKGSGSYSKLELMPFRNDSGSYIMVRISDGAGGKGASLSSDSFPIGKCMIEERREPDDFFCDIDPYVCRMLCAGRISKQEIVSSYPYRSAVKQGVSRFGIVKMSSGAFLIGAVPVFDGSGRLRMNVIVVPSDTSELIDDSYFEVLTPREGNVVRLMLEGMNSERIGALLGISEGTVKRELFSSCKKLKVKGRMGMMMKIYHLEK